MGEVKIGVKIFPWWNAEAFTLSVSLPVSLFLSLSPYFIVLFISLLWWRDRHERWRRRWWRRRLAQVGTVCWQRRKVEKADDRVGFKCVSPSLHRWGRERVLAVSHLSAADKRPRRAPEYQCQRRECGSDGKWKLHRSDFIWDGIISYDWHVLFPLLNEDKTIKLQSGSSPLRVCLKALTPEREYEHAELPPPTHPTPSTGVVIKTPALRFKKKASSWQKICTQWHDLCTCSAKNALRVYLFGLFHYSEYILLPPHDVRHSPGSSTVWISQQMHRIRRAVLSSLCFSESQPTWLPSEREGEEGGALSLLPLQKTPSLSDHTLPPLFSAFVVLSLSHL